MDQGSGVVKFDNSPQVYLVGSGPGDPGLMTLSGAEALKKADVVLYDRLVNPELLALAGSKAECIYVGKQPGKHTCSQNEINQLLVKHAREGKVIVRLHGGDPFVFGRGGEETAFLTAADISFQVISGVTSAIAVPASAGIPVTHREHASSFAVITGHRRQGTDTLPEIPRADTLVFLMPVSNLARIVKKLLANGVSPQTPAALVHCGTTAEQKTVRGKLGDICQQAQGITSPAVFVVGNVASLGETGSKFD